MGSSFAATDAVGWNADSPGMIGWRKVTVTFLPHQVGPVVQFIVDSSLVWLGSLARVAEIPTQEGRCLEGNREIS